MGRMSTSSSVNAEELPVACTLGRDDGAARMGRWQALAAAAHPTASREGHTLEVRFEHGLGIHAELEALASAEQQCCSFVNWTVTEEDGQPVLRVLAKPDSPEDVAFIAALFGAV